MTSRTLRLCGALGAAVIALAGCSNDEVAEVSLGVFTFKNITTNAFVDPVVTGVTCHVASIESPLQLSDPSESSVSCRQTGEITPEMIAAIPKGKDGDVVFRKSKSIFLKNMKIRRIYDEANQTLLYISYSTKETSGSFKHSLSTVPLWGTAAYRKPMPGGSGGSNGSSGTNGMNGSNGSNGVTSGSAAGALESNGTAL